MPNRSLLISLILFLIVLLVVRAPRLLHRRLSFSRRRKELFRAVGPNELADLKSNGRFRVQPGGTEGKYFFETPEQASNFARMMGDKAYTTTAVRVSPSELAKSQLIHPAGEGPALFFATPDVPRSRVVIFGQSVLL